MTPSVYVKCTAMVFLLGRRRILLEMLSRVVECHPSAFQFKDSPRVFRVVLPLDRFTTLASTRLL